MNSTSERPVFVLHLRPEKGVDPIRALRNVLKSLLRRHGLKCISVEDTAETTLTVHRDG